MQVKGRIQLLAQSPKTCKLRRVVIHHVVGGIHLRKSIDQRALKTQVINTPLQLAASGVRVLHGQGRQGLKPIRPERYLLGQKVIGPLGNFNGFVARVEGLHGGCIERQNHHLHAMGIHFAQSAVLNVHEPCAQLLPYHVRQKAVGVLKGFRNGEMLFEPNFSLHGDVPVDCPETETERL